MRQYLPLLLLLSIFQFACVDLEFDEPPVGGEPVNITPNASILDLKARYVPGKFTTITDSLVIRAVVIADDESGNYYKTIIVQDSTAGIEVKINGIGLYNQFPIGREVFILAKGLVVSDYNGLVQIGGGTYLDNGQTRLGGIEEILIGQYLVAGGRNQALTPKVKTIATLNTNDLSTLVTLEDVQFATGSSGETYADPVTQFSVNRTAEDCNKNSIILRTSGYARFAGVRTPTGKGSLTGVLGVFGGTLQFFIRDTFDLIMNDPRCGSGGASGLESIDQNFQSVGNNADAELDGWLNVASKGTRLWRGKTFSGNTYVQSTAFTDTSPELENWLITPAINTKVAKTLTFKSSVSYWTHASGTVLFSSNFDGTDPSKATWINLSATLPDAGTANFAWVNSGTIDLPITTGKGYIAWRYNGSGPNGQTTTFILDDVVVKNK